VKESLIAFFEWIGDLGIFYGRLARVAFVSPHEGRELLRQLEAVGPKSFMLVAQAGAMAFVENMQALSNNFLLRGFFNRRGYENSADLTKYTVSRLPAGSTLKTFVYAGDRIFIEFKATACFAYHLRGMIFNRQS
jgi:hypothetical protein